MDISNLTYPETQELILRLQAHARSTWYDYSLGERIKSKKRSKQRAESDRRLETEAIQMFKRVELGDIVRVTGVRNAQYPYREVTSKQSDQFTGWQMRYMRDGTWQRGSEHTTHMSNKIRAFVRAEMIA